MRLTPKAALAERQKWGARFVIGAPGFWQNKTEKMAKEQIKQYSRLIDSIDNSIRVQANEPEAVRSHDTGLRRVLHQTLRLRRRYRL